MESIKFETKSATIIKKSELYKKMIESGECEEDVLNSIENQCKTMFGDDIFNFGIEPRVLKLYDFLTIPFEETQYKLRWIAWRDDFKEILDEMPFIKSTIFSYCGKIIFGFLEYLSCAKFLLMFGKIKDLGYVTESVKFADIMHSTDQEMTNFFWDLVFIHGVGFKIVVEPKQKEAFNWHMRKLLKVYDKYTISFYRQTCIDMYNGNVSMYVFLSGLEKRGCEY